MAASRHSELRLAWVGFHFEGILAFDAVLTAGYRIEALITLDEESAKKRSGAADYSEIACRFGVPVHRIKSINDPGSLRLLREVTPDLVFVIGWSQIVSTEALHVPRYGMIGAHASLLPHNRGSAPINWAIIRGETVAGNSLITLAEGVDEGELLDQESFPVTPFDTCETLYEKVAETNRVMILRCLERLNRGEWTCRPQPRTDEPKLPRRRPADGLIDWAASSRQAYDFVRALTRPYPGAFTFMSGAKFLVWKAALWPGHLAVGPPGEILGPVVSPTQDACGIAVACGSGAVVLLELQAEDGSVLAGRALAEYAFPSKRFESTCPSAS